MKIKNCIKGMRIDTVNRKIVFSVLDKEIKSNSLNYISITNSEAMYFGNNNKNHFKYINESYLSLCDGIGVLIAAKFHNIKIERYNGPDFFEDVMREGQKYGWTHYFLGGKPGIAEELTAYFYKKYPSVKILGNYSPPFRELTIEEERRMINIINELKPNFLWVSLGLPKQENWIAKYNKKLNTNFMVGVGAAFDYLTGNIKRAPLFYRKIGMEWFYRTLFERRLVVRQIRGFKFMFNAILNNKINK